jgi:hypothetical protein
MKMHSILIWIGILGFMAFGLFQIKHAVQGLEEEYAGLNRDILASKQQIHVLQAEWSYLNRPERLTGLAERHLDLEPMTPTQIGGFETARSSAATPASVSDGVTQ